MSRLKPIFFRNNLRVKVQFSALVSIIFLFAFACFPHEEQPSILDFEIETNTVSIEIQTYFETLIRDELNILALPKSDPSHERENFSSENLKLDRMILYLFENWQSLRSQFFFNVNGKDLKLELVDVRLNSTAFDIEATAITLDMVAKIPDNSEYLTIGWDQKFGDLVVREQGSKENLYSDYLSIGDVSPRIYLKRNALLSKSNKFLSYVRSGLYHIVPIGYDHILFIIGLYLFSTHFRPLFLQVTLFTIAHSLTLILASFEIISISSLVVEPIIAASIVYVGLENYFFRPQTSYRGLIIFGFGLLHGLGFANVLDSLELSKDGILIPLLGFNIGVEIGQILILILCFVIFGYWFSDKHWYRPRIVRPLSGILISVGSFWFISRLIE